MIAVVFSNDFQWFYDSIIYFLSFISKQILEFEDLDLLLCSTVDFVHRFPILALLLKISYNYIVLEKKKPMVALEMNRWKNSVLLKSLNFM